MSRTDKTAPWRVRKARGDLDGFRYFYGWSDPNKHAAVKDWWRAKRHAARQQLHEGREPEPTRTRHGIEWDLW